MDSHNDLLGELASDAALERSDFIVQSTEQLRRFVSICFAHGAHEPYALGCTQKLRL